MNERTKELDSLRGIAIILVIAAHTLKRANSFTHHETLYFISNMIAFGWVGVDIFFVLSGFLITSILLRTRDDKNYFKNFYMRRALRIFPLYYICITLILFFTPILDPEYTARVPHAIPFLLLYQQNWLILSDGSGLNAYLFVTWSLAIEEQFYLIWPTVVYFTRRETLIKISVGIIVLSIITRISCTLLWDDTFLITRFFYLNTFSRFEELVSGALLAALFTNPAWKARLQPISFPVFLAALSAFVALCISVFPNTNPALGSIPLTLGVYTLAAVFSAALIATLMTHPEKSTIRRVFQNSVLAFFGKYSYSMYLLHLPISILLLEALWRTGIRGWKGYVSYTALAYVITILASLLTWHLLEKHMLNLKRHFEYK
ncbi:MAG: acyltransferase [Chloroflexi bacterium]|nr:acyltransferase [Chloroflexota bacterium]